MSKTIGRISQIQLVMIPSTDQDRSVAFYEALGFERRNDIEVTHNRLRSIGVDVDAEVARKGAPAAIRLGGVELVGPEPPMFWFRDPDGNALLMVEVA